ncbi:Cof-type HAD-IIB family hydrolase [Gordoniibacillus kamchatkensis]|uniref:Cof-type HAD-IIB family hydrolase n=1 Tax=Gordoniibacillus kamchatkensis TaxID=1590651 RepID=UPI0009E2037D|nr:Cof-type HAD-IIB family hydrolase [Paenibacillus sp. VKM B-2647]
MPTYKLVALDMDGTLLNEEKQISAENRAAIFAALDAGVTVMVSTGRGVQSASPYIEELGLATPIVAVNGSEVWKSPKELLQRVLLPTSELKAMHQMAVELDTWYWAYAVEGIFNKDGWTESVDDIRWLKFGYYTEEEAKLAHIRQTLESWGTLEITNSHPCNLELNPKGISKASGIRAVCDMLGIEMDEVIAMGDSENDLSMIREAGLGVAMGNAQESVKAAADIVTVTNDEHGVAKVIREYILQGRAWPGEHDDGDRPAQGNNIVTAPKEY